jgi:predicted nucleic acid-binding protein
VVKGYLLDANVLIALSVHEHPHHTAAETWARRHEGLSISPISEGALVRFWLRAGVGGEAVASELEALYDQHHYHFWPDSISYRQAQVKRLRGYRQATDAYLVALAKSQGVKLATFDEGLAQEYPADTVLIPRAGQSV